MRPAERPRQNAGNCADARGSQPTAADFCAAVIFDKGLGDREVFQKLALLAQDNLGCGWSSTEETIDAGGDDGRGRMC